MTDLILPAGTKPSKTADEPKIEKQEVEEPKATQLPTPAGYHILCAVPDIEEKFDSGLIKADLTVKHEEALATVLFVVAIGPDAYKDTAKFPSGPWCKEGDFIIVRPHSGSKLIIHGKQFRLINDDTVEAVTLDPRGIKRS